MGFGLTGHFVKPQLNNRRCLFCVYRKIYGILKKAIKREWGPSCFHTLGLNLYSFIRSLQQQKWRHPFSCHPLFLISLTFQVVAVVVIIYCALHLLFLSILLLKKCCRCFSGLVATDSLTPGSGRCDCDSPPLLVVHSTHIVCVGQLLRLLFCGIKWMMMMCRLVLFVVLLLPAWPN